jgi:hypothetical protein
VLTSLLSLGRALLRVHLRRPGITQQVCPARVDRACWVTVVHPCREEHLSIAGPTVKDARFVYPDLLLELDTCYLIEASGSLSRWEPRKDL